MICPRHSKERSRTGLPESRRTSFLRNGVTAHRGNSSAYPENTMAAFESAIEIGVDWIELDIHKTGDGELVVIHDADTKRVGNVDVRIAHVTYGRLLEIDVAYQFRKSKGFSRERCPKAHVPLLREVLALVRSQKNTRISIQPKVAEVREVLHLVGEMEAEIWVGINDGDLEKMKTVKKLAPWIPVFYDRNESDIRNDIREAKSFGFETVVLHWSRLNADEIRAIHRAGLEAGIWTVNDPNVMRVCLSMGIDRIYTDAPDLLLQIKKT